MQVLVGLLGLPSCRLCLSKERVHLFQWRVNGRELLYFPRRTIEPSNTQGGFLERGLVGLELQQGLARRFSLRFCSSDSSNYNIMI